MGVTDRFLGLEGRRHSKKFNAILSELDAHQEAPALEMVRDAYELARQVHANQYRKKSNESYIVHPLDVALACAEHWMDDVSVTAAILHDCIEDDEQQQLAQADLAQRFNPEVALIVEGLTKLRHGGASFGLERLSKEELKFETIKKLLTATATDDIRTIVIKIFDRADNIQTIDVFRPDKQRRIAQETLQFYVPVAARLGLFKEAREMEDHVMRVLQPQGYKGITRWLSSAKRRIDRNVGKTVRDIKKTLRSMGVTCESQLYHKGVYTIFESLRSEGLPLRRIDEGCNFNLCLVVNDVDACFRTLNLVHRSFIHLPERFRDFINNPKVNGYQSLHTIVTGPDIPKIQVLIRTTEMNVANHIGIIAQLRGGKLQDTAWLDELVDSLRATESTEMLDLTSRVFFPEIDVLTPKGDPRKMPEGSTALDFAYMIHTEVGDLAQSATVDGHPRPLSSVLRSGQKVEIVTSDEVKPSYQRLAWVTTTRAAVSIRKALQRKERDAIRDESTRFLHFCQRKFGIVMRPDMPEFQALLDTLGYDSEWEFGEDLYAGRISYDQVLPYVVDVTPNPSFKELIKVLHHQGILSDEEMGRTLVERDEDTLRTMLRTRIAEHLRDEAAPDCSVNIPNLMVSIPMRLAGCCRPEFGDDIIAYTSRGRVAAIHRRSCKTIRYVAEHGSVHVSEASWKGPPQTKNVRFEITGRDRRGLMLSVSTALSGMKVDAQSIHLAAEDDGTALGHAVLELNEMTSTDEVCQRLRAIPGITSVAVAPD